MQMCFSRLSNQNPLTMASNKTSRILASLERKLGINFVEDLFQDFLDTQAFATFSHHTSVLQGAYDSLRTCPDWAMEVRTAGEIYLSSVAGKAAYLDGRSEGFVGGVFVSDLD